MGDRSPVAGEFRGRARRLRTAEKTQAVNRLERARLQPSR